MSASSSSRTSDLAARQVEQIVAAAQQAADQIRHQAETELEALRREAKQEGESIRQDARRKAEDELTRARKDAIMLTEDARRDAELIVSDAQAKSDELRDKTARAVKGRVASAEVASAEVLEEAKALSAGMSQLARSLGEQAERILREVQAAHQRMQADLRIGPAEEPQPRSAGEGQPSTRSPSSGEPADDSEPRREGVPPRQRTNPFDGLEVPAWERR